MNAVNHKIEKYKSIEKKNRLIAEEIRSIAENENMGYTMQS